MLVVGLTGNFGSGKSTLLDRLGRRARVHTFDMDRMAKLIISTEEFSEVVRIILGEEVFIGGVLDTGRVGEIIFRDTCRRELLEKVLHPVVLEMMFFAMGKARREGKEIFIAESAVLFEKCLHFLFDVTISVTCPLEERRRRLKGRRNFTDEQIDRRIATQMSERDKAELADLVVDNSGEADRLDHESDRIMEDLCQRGLTATWENAVVRMLKWRYTEPSRAYHNWNHVEHCLRMFKTLRHLAKDPETIEWAILFHDAWYVAGSEDNEEMSAGLARACLDEPMNEEAARLIMLTAHHQPQDDDIDGQIVCDCDLAVLAYPPDMFDQYEVLIREEYDFVPEEDFRRGRAAFIEGLLARESIFRTEQFRREFEAKARENLKRSLERLK